MNPLPAVRLQTNGKQAYAGTDGRFNLELGATKFPGETINVEIQFNGIISATGLARLNIINEIHESRFMNFNISQQGITVSNGTADVGAQTVGGDYDCEIFRIGAKILQDYRAATDVPLHNGEQVIYRASDTILTPGGLPFYEYFWGPLAFYDDIWLKEDFVAKNNPNQLGSARIDTLYHEFGHTIRHFADGDAQHWDDDETNFNYAQTHSASDLNAFEYAFNEAWGNYWRMDMRNSGTTLAAGDPLDPELDWVEGSIGKYLNSLASPLGSASPGMMFDVLQRNRGLIHSLWEFEQAYCLQVPLPNVFCTAGRAPLRAKPPACPPGYTFQNWTVGHTGNRCTAPAGNPTQDEDDIGAHARALPITSRFFSTTGALKSKEFDHHLPIEVVPGSVLLVTISGTGDPDLYVKFDHGPSTTHFDCRSYSYGATESCSVIVPATESLAYVSVFGFAASTYTVQVFAKQQVGAVTYNGFAPNDVFAQGSLDANELLRYIPLRVRPGDRYDIDTLGPLGDTDLYVRFNVPPQTSANQWDCRSAGVTGNESCSGIVPDGAQVAYIMVKGYSAAKFGLYASFH